MKVKNANGKILGNFVSLLSGEIIAKAFGFLTTIYLARTLGPEAFGILGFVWAVYGFFSFISNPGLDMIATRELAAGQVGATQTVRTVVSLKTLLTAGALALFILFAQVFVEDSTTTKVMMLQSLNFLVGIITLDFLYHALQQMKHVAFRRALFGFLYLVLVLWLVSDRVDVALVPLAMFGAGMISLGPQALLYIGKLRFRFPSGPALSRATLLRTALPLGASSFMLVIYGMIDTILLGFMRTQGEVGLYTAAVKIALLVGVIPSLLHQTFFPSLSAVSRNKEWREVLGLYIIVLTLGGFAMGGTGLFAAREVMTIIYGARYLGGVMALQILFFNIIIKFLAVAFANPMIALKMEKQYLFIVTSGAVVNIIFNILLIPSFGIEGAAAATVLSEIAVLINALFILKKHVQFRVGKLILLSLLQTAASFAGGEVGVALGVGGIGSGLIFMSIFLILFLFFRQNYRELVSEIVRP